MKQLHLFAVSPAVAARRMYPSAVIYRPIAGSDRATCVGHASGGERDSNDGQPVPSDAHSPDAGGNRADQGAPGIRVEAPYAKYRYSWGPRFRVSHLAVLDRKGQICRLLARGAMNSALVEFEDGERHVISRNALRRPA